MKYLLAIVLLAGCATAGPVADNAYHCAEQKAPDVLRAQVRDALACPGTYEDCARERLSALVVSAGEAAVGCVVQLFTAPPAEGPRVAALMSGPDDDVAVSDEMVAARARRWLSDRQLRLAP